MCAFVNYTNVHSAIAAKDDILGRLGGKLHSNGLSSVRIGYGKPESVPSTPAQPVNAAFEAILQNSPTRALWIGSLPSNITTNELLALFSQFGPIESARVLTHKNCGASRKGGPRQLI
jgi:protein JSN1